MAIAQQLTLRALVECWEEIGGKMLKIGGARVVDKDLRVEWGRGLDV